MKILICGMPRSMTTWAFNVVRLLLSGKGIETIWIDPSAAALEENFKNEKRDVVAKCHHYSKTLAEAADLIIYSYRDIRTAAVSYHRKFQSQCARGELDAWIESGRLWLPRANLVLRYESVEHQPLEAIKRIRQLIKERLGEGSILDVTDEHLLDLVDFEFVKRQETTIIDYDGATMITPKHRTYQPPPENLTGTDKILYARIEMEYLGWLTNHGYLSSNDHGQELEYHLAKELIKSIPNPVVVDVGVERGSFTQLACDAGAIKVVGFEPLPRHFECLQSKYAGVYKIQIFPYAISSMDGLAQLHIATNLEGEELDFHHTLSDLGDSSTVIRSGKTLDVKAVSLASLLMAGVFPDGIDFLKIDTDGHDLSVLEGLGAIRPHVILAEYWDNLPDTSGANIYSLKDLSNWALEHGYGRIIVVRRHGRLEFVELDAPHTIDGDWGNVFFLRNDFDYEKIRPTIEQFSKNAYAQACEYVSGLIRECEAKEAEIQRLSAAVRELRSQDSLVVVAQLPIQGDSIDPVQPDSEVASLLSQLAERDLTIESLKADLVKSEMAQIEKEEVIRALSKAMFAYRIAYIPFRPFRSLRLFQTALQPFRVISRHVKAMLRPRLGRLNHYPPQPLRNPKDVHFFRPKNSAPKISIVTPSFRQGEYIERTVQSVLNQKYPNLEYFVQDGGSQDSTVDVLNRYADQLTGWVSEKDNGQSHAINLGFAKTTGEIMAWLNSDDLLLPGALAKVAEYFAAHPEVDVVYGNRILIDESDNEIGRWVLPPHNDEVLSWADFVPQETLFWRRSLWEKVNGIDENFRFAMDWDLLLRFRNAGARMVRLPLFLGAFRIHESQKTSAVINEIGVREMDFIRERIFGRSVLPVEIRNAITPYLFKHILYDLAWRLRLRCGMSE